MPVSVGSRPQANSAHTTVRDATVMLLEIHEMPDSAGCRTNTTVIPDTLTRLGR